MKFCGGAWAQSKYMAETAWMGWAERSRVREAVVLECAGCHFVEAGAVDGGERELAWCEVVGGGDGIALGEVAFDGLVGCDFAVLEGEGAVGGEVVGGVCVVANLDGNGSIGKRCVGCRVGLGETSEGRVTLVGDC